MNGTQLQTTLAPLVAFVAGILAGKNVFGLDATAWTNILLYVVGGAGDIWGTIAARKTALVSTVADLPEVQSVKLEPTVPGNDVLVTATPSNVTK